MATKVIVAHGHVHGEEVDSWLFLTAKGGICVLAALGDLADTDVTASLATNILMQKRLQAACSVAATRITTFLSWRQCTWPANSISTIW